MTARTELFLGLRLLVDAEAFSKSPGSYGAPSHVWFVAALRERARDWVEGEEMLAAVIMIGGAAYVAVDMAAIGLR